MTGEGAKNELDDVVPGHIVDHFRQRTAFALRVCACVCVCVFV